VRRHRRVRYKSPLAKLHMNQEGHKEGQSWSSSVRARDRSGESERYQNLKNGLG
jgi:hypothetical protein